MVAWVIDRIGVDAVGIGTDYCPGHPPARAATGATAPGRATRSPR